MDDPEPRTGSVSRPRPWTRGLRSLAGAFSFPRDAAARATLSDLGAFVRGHPPGGISIDDARFRRNLAAGRARLAEGDHGGAEAIAVSLLAAHPASVPALELRLAAQQAANRTVDALRTVRALRLRADAPRLAALERRLARSLLVEDVAWTPALPPRADDTCRPDGCTIVLGRARAAMTADRRDWADHVVAAMSAAGLGPVVLERLRPGTAPEPRGAPEPGRSACLVEQRPLSLGPYYPAAAPPDIFLTDYAWLAAREIRELDPPGWWRLSTRPTEPSSSSAWRCATRSTVRWPRSSLPGPLARRSPRGSPRPTWCSPGGQR